MSCFLDSEKSKIITNEGEIAKKELRLSEYCANIISSTQQRTKMAADEWQKTLNQFEKHGIIDVKLK